MKKRSLMILAILIAFAMCLVSCKQSVGTPEDNAATEEDTEEEQTDGEEEESYMIGYSPIDMVNPYFVTLRDSIQEELDNEGYSCRVISKDPGTDANLQESQIKEMIEDGIDAIVLCPVDWEKITPALQMLKEADVKIINVDTQVLEMDYVDAYIGSDNYRAGQLCGEDLITKCPQGGKIAILECPTQNSVNDRIRGFEEVISKADVGFEIVARADIGGQFDRALEETTKILKEHPDVDVIMCANDQTAVGAKTAVNTMQSSSKEENSENIIIYGVDGSPDIKKELAKHDGQIAGTAAQSPINMGKTTADITMKVLLGEEYEKETMVDVFMIDSDNVDMYGVDGWQ